MPTGRPPTCGMSLAPSALALRDGVELVAPEVGGAMLCTRRNETGEPVGLGDLGASSRSRRGSWRRRRRSRPWARARTGRRRPRPSPGRGRTARRRRRRCRAPARRRGPCGRASGRSRSPRRRPRWPRATMAAHLGDVVGGGVLVAGAALAHDVDAQRRVGDVAAMSMAYSRRAERVEVLGEGLPLPLDALVQRGAGDVLDALHQLDQPLVLPGRTGAKPTPQLPVTTVVTPWQAEGSSSVVPGGLAVVVGVDVDEAGRDDEARGVDGLGGVARRPSGRPRR